MMRPLAPMLAVILWITGCASHFYRQDEDRIHLYLKDSHAREVLFSSSLEGYGFQKADKIDGATWGVTVPRGREFRYFYVIDGSVHVPDCPSREKDDFGNYNCLFGSHM